MPRYYDAEWNDCKVSVRHKGIRGWPILKSCPFKSGAINLRMRVRNKNHEEKKAIKYSWTIMCNGKHVSNIPQNSGEVIIAPGGKCIKDLEYPRLTTVGYYLVRMVFGDGYMKTLLEFEIPKVMDAVIATWGFRIMWLIIGVGLTILGSWIASLFS